MSHDPAKAAQQTIAQALAPSTDLESFEIFCARMLAEADDLGVTRLMELADRTSEVAERATQRCNATTELLRRTFERAGVTQGVSSWEPSYSALGGLVGGVK